MNETQEPRWQYPIHADYQNDQVMCTCSDPGSYNHANALHADWCPAHPYNRCSPFQRETLDRNPHLVLLSLLDDGDALVADNAPANPRVFPDGHFGPYILTRAGQLQDVNYHYQASHLLHQLPHTPTIARRVTCEHGLPMDCCAVCWSERKAPQHP